jgi:hypothetical protein
MPNVNSINKLIVAINEAQIIQKEIQDEIIGDLGYLTPDNFWFESVGYIDGSEDEHRWYTLNDVVYQTPLGIIGLNIITKNYGNESGQVIEDCEHTIEAFEVTTKVITKEIFIKK